MSWRAEVPYIEWLGLPLAERAAVAALDPAKVTVRTAISWDGIVVTGSGVQWPPVLDPFVIGTPA